MTKSDIQLKQDIEDELHWDPKVNSAQIGVNVDNGAVSLLGTVDSYAEKWAAEEATKRVSGVHTVALNLTVKILAEHAGSDSDIAAAVQHALRWNVYIPNTVTAQVNVGSVRLEGQVNWNYQRVTAERAVRYIRGVVEVHNLITLEPASPTAQGKDKPPHFWSRWFGNPLSGAHIKEEVLAALKRQAAASAAAIQVDTQGTKVTLSGHAPSWQSIVDAANAAWAAPGVTHVIDRVKLSQ